MKTKNHSYRLFILLMLLIYCSVTSQNFKLYYNLEFVKDTITKNIEKRNMVLWVEKQNFLFSSKNFIEDTIENKDDYSFLLDEDIEFTTMKKENTLSKFYHIDQNLYATNENFTNLNWEITNQKKSIDSIQCQLATLQYKGRNWEAWFSTKYPLTFGPYIFNGLPGAIIELRDTKNNYSFKLAKISNSNGNINKLLKLRQSYYSKPIAITNKQLEKVYFSNYSNPYKRMKDKGIIYMIDEKTGERQPPPDFDKMAKSAQKYIRNTNNPIELSEAIKYP